MGTPKTRSPTEASARPDDRRRPGGPLQRPGARLAFAAALAVLGLAALVVATTGASGPAVAGWVACGLAYLGGAYGTLRPRAWGLVVTALAAVGSLLLGLAHVPSMALLALAAAGVLAVLALDLAERRMAAIRRGFARPLPRDDA